MTDSPSELVAAARHLAQWGRSRQAVWQDASRDLLAALGNRYASFDDLQAALPPPPPLPRPQPVLPPQVFAPAPAPTPIIAAPPPPPVVHVAPVAAPVKAPARSVAPAPARLARPRANRGFLTAAALIVVAALASPALWRAYEDARVAVPTTNTLTIESTPPGSVVVIDGIESGKTPLSTSLMLGIHHVELRYRKNVRTLDVDVVAGNPIVTRVDWTKRPPSASKKRPAPKGAPPARGPVTTTPAAAAPAPTDRAAASPEVTSAVAPVEAADDIESTAAGDRVPEPPAPSASPRP